MTTTPLQFAERILTKYGLAARQTKGRASLVYLAAASPARAVHVLRERFMERRERLTIVRPIEVRLFVNAWHPKTIRHADHTHAYRRYAHHERMSILRQAVQEHHRLSRIDREARKERDPNPAPLHLHVKQTFLASQRVMRLGSMVHHPTFIRNYRFQLAQQPPKTVPMAASWVHASASPPKDAPSTAGISHPQRLTHAQSSSTYRAARSVTLLHASPTPNAAPVNSPPRREEALNHAAPPIAPAPPVTAAPSLDMKRLTDDVYQAIERKLRIERQRKGL
ncbi:hypothetical protein I8J29_05155 [Paenibacillus sp. MWE-103]|uniref:Relaxase/mobilization nuclease-like protein n=1 Tax=Paenibacillus artemisiicola TaxID=1172618 RepID=A0ABS3W5I1_9BACL|nr:hypothetical protein [Paenibacillus artemisiicola]MBO7743572.1 hypothetical protein [Paenibacillus artemisiicola]